MSDTINFMNNYIHDWAIEKISIGILMGLGSILWIVIQSRVKRILE